jgi:hypothetical protein
MALMMGGRELILCYTDGYYLFGQTKSSNRFSDKARFVRGSVFKHLLYWNCISISSVVVNRSLAKDQLYCIPDFRYSEEYELFLRLSLLGRFDFLNEPLIYYRVHPGNFSRNVELQIEESKFICGLHAKEIESSRISLERVQSRLYRSVVLNLIRQADIKKARSYGDYLMKFYSFKNIVVYILLRLGLTGFLSFENLHHLRRVKRILSAGFGD